MPALGAVSSLATLGAVGVASDLATAPDDRSRMLPVHQALVDLFPWGGLRRGVTVAVRGSTSLLFALLAQATETGSWAALVGMPNLGLRAAAELGVAVDRLALVRHPGADLPRVVAALLDGMDLVAVDPARLTDSQVHRLSARARHRGAVLLSAGAWPGADLELTCEAGEWSGLGDGHGHLKARETRVAVRGRRAVNRQTGVRLHLPGPGGTAATMAPSGTLPVPEGATAVPDLHPVDGPDSTTAPGLRPAPAAVPGPRPLGGPAFVTVPNPRPPDGLAANALKDPFETFNAPKGSFRASGAAEREAAFEHGDDPAFAGQRA
jgi:hypothetical protein